MMYLLIMSVFESEDSGPKGGQNIQSVDDSGNVTKNGQEDVDEEVCAATTLEEYTKRRKKDGKDDLDDVAVFLVSF